MRGRPVAADRSVADDAVPGLGAPNKNGALSRMERGTSTQNSRRVWIPIVQCAWCGAISVGGVYLHIPLVKLLSGDWRIRLPGFPVIVASMTHSVCRDCAVRVRARAGRFRRGSEAP